MGAVATARRQRATDDGWRIPDGLWALMEPLLPPRPAHRYGGHRPRVADRQVMDAIFFVARTGCQWNALNVTGLCSSSAAHRRFQEWTAAGVFQRLWAACLEQYDDVAGLDWLWQAMDGAITKAPLGGGENRSQPGGPWQARRQAQSARRWRRHPLGAVH